MSENLKQRCKKSNHAYHSVLINVRSESLCVC